MQCERCLEVRPLINLRCVHSICTDCDSHLRSFAEEKNKPCLVKDYCSGGYLLRKSETESDALERLRNRRRKIYSMLDMKLYELERKSRKTEYGIRARVKYLRNLFEERHDMRIGPTVILIGYSYKTNKFRYALVQDEVTHFPRRDIIRIDVYFGNEKEYTTRLTIRNGIHPNIVVAPPCSDLIVFNEISRGKECMIISAGGVITLDESITPRNILHDYDYRATYCVNFTMFNYDIVHFNIYEKSPKLEHLRDMEQRDYLERYNRREKYDNMIGDMVEMQLEKDKTISYIKWDKKFCVELKNLDTDIEILEIRSKEDPINLRTLPIEE